MWPRGALGPVGGAATGPARVSAEAAVQALASRLRFRNAQNFDITKVEAGTISTTGISAFQSGQPSVWAPKNTSPRLIARPTSEIAANRANCGPCIAGRRKVSRLLPK